MNAVRIAMDPAFRDAYTDAVIFGKADVKGAFDQAAEKVKTLAAGS